MKKYYGAFIVSTKPIDLSGLSDDPNIRHLITQDFEMESDIIGSGDGWRIRKSAPEYCGGLEVVHKGDGEAISVVIADWFRKLCASHSYFPLYKKRRSDH